MSQYLKDRKDALKEGEFLAVGDFAENYTCVIQDAIQSHYWTNEQVTIHPNVVYHKENGEVKHGNFALISEDLHHYSNAVNLFITKLVQELKKKYTVKKIIYFSDGASSQYKNKSNLINLLTI